MHATRDGLLSASMLSRTLVALVAAAVAAKKRGGKQVTPPLDAHEAAGSEFRAVGASNDHFKPAVGEQFVPVIGDGIHEVKIRNRTGSPARLRQRMLALLNAQCAGRRYRNRRPCRCHPPAPLTSPSLPRVAPMLRSALSSRAGRGGSTLAEQLIFSTTIAPPFLLDEPAKAMWLDENNHKISTVNWDALRCDFSKFNHTLLLNWQHWRGEFTRQRKLLNYRSFEEMRRRCFSAGNGGHLRAVKTIRQSGELDLVAKQSQPHDEAQIPVPSVLRAHHSNRGVGCAADRQAVHARAHRRQLLVRAHAARPPPALDTQVGKKLGAAAAGPRRQEPDDHRPGGQRGVDGLARGQHVVLLRAHPQGCGLRAQPAAAAEAAREEGAVGGPPAEGDVHGMLEHAWHACA